MNNILRITIISFIFLSLFSCSSDDDYYTGDEAKNALKHEWSVSAIEIHSTYQNLDKLPNYALKTLILNMSVFSKDFDGEYVTTSIHAKHTDDSALYKDRYVVMDNIMYIESTALENIKIPYTFQVSKKELILNFKFDKELFMQLYLLLEKTDPEISEILTPFLTDIPDDYAGDIVLHLER